LNYDAWLGSTPYSYYTEKRVHPQNDYSRPGWLRCEQFGAGMITGWGTHHVDIAHWGMDTEYTGPVEVWGKAEFPKSGLWNVHGSFTTYGKYANGVKMTISTELPNGVKFVGSEGWIFVTRGNYKASANEPAVPNQKALSASNPKIIESVIGANEINLYRSDEHHGNWLDCITTRKQPITPVEVGHRGCSTCLIHHIAMRLPRPLHWDPLNERFINDDEANALLNRQHRFPYLVKGLS
jgi:predicted dehydrogenase